MCLQFSTNLVASIPISLSYDLAPINTDDGIIYAALILFGLYFLIISEVRQQHSSLKALEQSLSFLPYKLIFNFYNQNNVVTLRFYMNLVPYDTSQTVDFLSLSFFCSHRFYNCYIVCSLTSHKYFLLLTCFFLQLFVSADSATYKIK